MGTDARGQAASTAVRGPRRWWRRLVTRNEQSGLTGKYVRNGVCAGCGPWCEDHGWKVPEPTGNPEVDLAAAKAYHARVNAYLGDPR